MRWIENHECIIVMKENEYEYQRYIKLIDEHKISFIKSIVVLMKMNWVLKILMIKNNYGMIIHEWKLIEKGFQEKELKIQWMTIILI